jgi:hypothetical protein
MFPQEDPAPASGRNLPTPQAINAVERYNGQGDAHAWLDSFNVLADLYLWSDEVCLAVARIRMTGPAQRWACLRKFLDWVDFQDQFARRFGETRESAVARLSRCIQQADESPKAFADRFLEDAERAGRTEDEALVYQFLRHLRPELREEAARKQPRSIEQIVDFCNYWLGATADDSLLYSGPYQTGASSSRRVRFPDEDNSGYRPRRPDTPERDSRWSGRTEYGGRSSRFNSDSNTSRNNHYSNNGYSNNSYSNNGYGNNRNNTGMRSRFNDRSPSVSRPYRPAPRDAPSRGPSPAPDRSAAPAAATSAAADIDGLTKQLERLQLDNAKDKEIRHLRFLLQQQQRQQNESGGINCMLPCESESEEDLDNVLGGSLVSSALVFHAEPAVQDEPPIADLVSSPIAAGSSTYYMDPCPSDAAASAGADSIDPDYLAHLLAHLYNTKRGNERTYERVPHKRQAIQVDGLSPYVPQSRPPPPRPVAPPSAQRPAHPAPAAAAGMPRERAPFNVPPYQAPPPAARFGSSNTAAAARATPAAAAPAAAPARAGKDSAAYSQSTAAKLANSMGKDLATKVKTNLQYEVCKDTAVVPQAVLTCMAGHLANDTRLVEQGQNMARQVETVVYKLSPAKRSPARATAGGGALNLAQPSEDAPDDATAAATAPVHLRHSGQKGATCTVIVGVNGRKIRAVVDTGACTTAITKDCLRRAGLLDYLRPELATSYINADGRKSKGCG